MKKILITVIVFSLGFLYLNAQEKVIAGYDSLSNFVGRNAKSYLGQEIYLMGLERGSHTYGYNGFVLDYLKDDDILNDKTNIYKPNGNYNSIYEELVSKYFHVLDVIAHPKEKEKEEFKDIFYLKLQELSSNDVIYYRYSAKSEITFPFAVRGFIEKQNRPSTLYVLFLQV